MEGCHRRNGVNPRPCLRATGDANYAQRLMVILALEEVAETPGATLHPCDAGPETNLAPSQAPDGTHGLDKVDASGDVVGVEQEILVIPQVINTLPVPKSSSPIKPPLTPIHLCVRWLVHTSIQLTSSMSVTRVEHPGELVRRLPRRTGIWNSPQAFE
jgi:hypothetical protein